jgi:DNA-binding NtrC family response regulator
MPTHDLKGFEVLIVDDNPDLRELLAEFFRERGLVATTAGDGRAAVAALERSAGRYRLVLTDVRMPGADGFAVLTAARLANPSAYVVVMTGYASIDSAINAVRLGAQDYLTKPFTLGQIDVVVRQATARFALEHENRRLTERGATNTLAAIEERLTAIEHLLSKVLALVGDSSRSRPF